MSLRSLTVPSPYGALFDYLSGRFADTVVLTLDEIEDLIGLPLPEAAHARPDWWANDGSDPAQVAHARAWTEAHRSATPNLFARTVSFERVPD